MASVVLDNMGVRHLMDGNVLVIPERRFLVEEACSGIHSVFALLTAAAFYSVLVRATAFRAVLLIASAVFWACFMNLLRVAATVFFYEQLQIDLGAGVAHTVTGFVTFALAVLFVSFTDQMLRFFTDPIDPQAVEFWKQRLNPFVQWWNRPPRNVDAAGDKPTAMPTTTPLGAAVVALAIGSVSLAAGVWQVLALQKEAVPEEAPTVIASLESDSLPAQLENWKRVDYRVEQREKNSILGDVSKIWTFQAATHQATVSIDYPFRGWHTLDGCYRGMGWEIDEYRLVPLSVASAAPDVRGAISEVRMHRSSGEQALLLFALLDRDGRTLRDPMVGSIWVRAARRILERTMRPLALQFPELDPGLGVTTQLQLLIVSDPEPISSEVAEDARQRFTELHSLVAGRFQPKSAPAPPGDTP